MADPQVDIAGLEAAFAKDPASAFAPLTEAYLEQGRFMEAMVVCKKGIKAEPDNTGGRLLLARVYAEQGKVPKAVDEVKKLIELDANSSSAHFFLGQLHERAGRFDESIESWQKAVELDPANDQAIEALRAKGIEVDTGPTPEEIAAQEAAEAEARGKVEEAAAAKAAEEARVAAEATAAAQASNPGIAVQPQSAPAASGALRGPKAGAFQQPATTQSAFMGGYDPIEQNRTRNKRLGLSFSLALFTVLAIGVAILVFSLKNASERAEAVQKFTVAAEKSIKRDTTKELLSAVEKLEQALAVDDGAEAVIAKIAYLYEVLQYERGLSERDLRDRIAKEVPLSVKDALAKAQDKAADNPYTLVASSISNLRRGDTPGAISALQQKKGNAFIDLRLADAYLHAGETKAAMALVDQHAKNVTHPGQLTFVGKAYRAAGKRVLGGLALNTALKTVTDHDVARAERALLSLELRDLTYASGDTKALSDMGKDNIGVLQYGLMTLVRGEIKRPDERSNESEADFKTATEMIPKHPDYLSIMAEGKKAEKKLSQAVALMQDAVKRDPARVGAWAKLIRIAAQARKIDAAKKAFADAQKYWPDHPELLAARGWIFYRTSKAKGIAELTTASKKLEDKNPEILTMIGILQLTKGDADSAVSTLTKAAENLKGTSGLVRAETYTTLGRALERAGRDQDAIGAYRQAIASNGTYADAYFHFGRILEKGGNDKLAKAAFTDAIRYGLDGRKKETAEEKIR